MRKRTNPGKVIHRVRCSRAFQDEVDVNIINLKHNGEWVFDSVRNHLANLISTFNEFDKALEEARMQVKPRERFY